MSHNRYCPDEYEARRKARIDACYDRDRYDYRSPYDCDEANETYQREYRYQRDQIEEDQRIERRREQQRQEERMAEEEAERQYYEHMLEQHYREQQEQESGR